MNARRWSLVVAGAIVALVQLQLTNPLTWDEIEYFRATRWIAEGRLPYRDYWEHHAPLQWLVFAPLAKVLASGAGTAAVLAMRWAQFPLWVVVAALLVRLSRRVEPLPSASIPVALALLVATPSFVTTAVQYRVDTLGSLGLVAALLFAASHRWVAFGAVMSLGVLANMRLAPLAIAAALLVVIADRQWWLRLSRIAAGVALVAGSFVALLMATGAWSDFLEAVVGYNRVADGLLEAVAGDLFTPLLLGPFRSGELSGIALWILAALGCAIALRRIRDRGPSQFVALLWVFSIVSTALMAVQYDYHLQTTWLLMVPLSAIALERISARVPRAATLASVVVILALVVSGVRTLSGGPGGELEYQNRVMTEVDRRVPPGGKVWDGTGYALRREPAYRYWFLPAGVRFMAEKKMIPAYDIRIDPPQAIVHNYRTHNWMVAFPIVGTFATTHYVPLYRNLWIPGFGARVPESGLQRVWTVVADDTYVVWASPLLAKHPWFTRPLRYALIEGPDAPAMEIPLERLTREPDTRMRWFVDGNPLPPGTRTFALRRGSRLELLAAPGQPFGVFVAPRGVSTLCTAPPERFVF